MSSVTLEGVKHPIESNAVDPIGLKGLQDDKLM